MGLSEGISLKAATHCC